MQTSALVDATIKRNNSGFFLLALAGFFFCSTPAMAQGDLLIFPKRVVFDGSKRSQQLNLANSGKDTARYIISVVQTRMKEDGGFESINQPDSGQNFADKFFRIFPRNVVLAPNESQTVKIQLTNTGQLLQGEYRSHLYFRAEPEKVPLGEENKSNDSNAISVKLVAVFGVTIPVIIRVGEPTTIINFSDVGFRMDKDTIPTVKMTFNRSGNMSTYGDISIDHTSLQGKVTRVGTIKGISVYTPNAARRSHVALDKNAGINYHSGKLHLVYTEQATKGKKLAEAEIVLH